jgi:hypothetical protein
MLVGQTTESAADLSAAFVAKLEAAGFKPVSKLETPTSTSISYRNEAKNQTIGVTINTSGQGRTVSLTYVGK